MIVGHDPGTNRTNSLAAPSPCATRPRHCFPAIPTFGPFLVASPEPPRHGALGGLAGCPSDAWPTAPKRSCAVRRAPVTRSHRRPMAKSLRRAGAQQPIGAMGLGASRAQCAHAASAGHRPNALPTTELRPRRCPQPRPGADGCTGSGVQARWRWASAGVRAWQGRQRAGSSHSRPARTSRIGRHGGIGLRAGRMLSLFALARDCPGLGVGEGGPLLTEHQRVDGVVLGRQGRKGSQGWRR